MSDYRPDLYGHVEASWRTAPPPDELVQEVLSGKHECPDCNVNLFIEEHPEQDGVYTLRIAHDETCPWLAEHGSSPEF